MALSDIYNRTRAILVGQGLGETPPIRLGASDAAQTISGQLVTFSLASGEGAKVTPGDTLSIYNPEDRNDAHVIYVTSIATDDVTGVKDYLGSPAVSVASTGLDGALFEQNPLVTGHTIFESIDTLIAAHLWPEIYKIETKTVTSPDLIDGQEAVATDVREIIHAWQRIGSTNYPVPFQRTPFDVDTSLSSTGKMAEFGWIDGSTGYFTCKTKLVEADEANDELTLIIAQGAAALALGGTFVETTLESTKKDNAEAVSQRSQVSSILWREFLTSKQQYAIELARRLPQRVVIDRG